MQQDEHTSSKPWDLVVIGAGIYGIQVARTYLELHPARHVIILEADRTVGGVWSQERVYNDFWTQTPLGILEFSDQPIHDIPKNDQYYGYFKASHVSKYLEDYCSSHVYSNASLTSRIRFSTTVTKVYKLGRIWRVHTLDDKESNAEYNAYHVVDASGLTSQSNWPDLQGSDHFHGRILHHKDFAKWERAQDRTRKRRIIVLGGAKSAADVAYSCATAGHETTWLIRRSGDGPASFVAAKGSLGYKNSNEAFYTRFTSLFLASLFSFGHGYDLILRWIHSTLPGPTLLQRIWRRINTKAWQEADYDRPDGKENGFHNLKPDTELFWQNDSTGINQRADFFDTIAKKVAVIREDILQMCDNGIVLKDGTVVEADTVICATGWKIEHPYYDQTTAATLGLPVDVGSVNCIIEAHWNGLLDGAVKDVHHVLPVLDSQWAKTCGDPKSSHTELTPFRLWKCIVPLHDQSIMFVGKLMLGNHFRNAEVQALFACAMLSGILELPPLEDREHDVARTIAWCRKRYPGGKGKLANWFYWDMVPYTDMLLAELGLRSHRKASTWKDLFRPCFADDLADLIDELKAKLNEQ